MGLFDRLQSMFQSDRVDVRERFEILRKAISGTMSKFYMARDRKTDKIIGLKIADREKWTAFEARFKGLQKPTEGEIAATLHHPLVVETYEYGMTNDGLQYIVMEFVKGPGLHQLLYNRDSCLEGHRVRLVRQMAEALEYVHEQKFIHRDVCPQELHLRQRDGQHQTDRLRAVAPRPPGIHAAGKPHRYAALYGARSGSPAVHRPPAGYFCHGRVRLPDLHVRTALAGPGNHRSGGPGPRYPATSRHPRIPPHPQPDPRQRPSCGACVPTRTIDRRP